MNEKFTFNLVTKMGATELKINNWRFWCKKGVDRFLVDFHFFQDRVNIWQTGWLVWTWKVSFCNCFCWFALRFREITLNNVSKKLSFRAESLGTNPTKVYRPYEDRNCVGLLFSFGSEIFLTSRKKKSRRRNQIQYT